MARTNFCKLAALYLDVQEQYGVHAACDLAYSESTLWYDYAPKHDCHESCACGQVPPSVDLDTLSEAGVAEYHIDMFILETLTDRSFSAWQAEQQAAEAVVLAEKQQQQQIELERLEATRIERDRTTQFMAAWLEQYEQSRSAREQANREMAAWLESYEQRRIAA